MLERTNGKEHLLIPDQVDRVDALNVDHIYVLEISSAEVQVFIHRFDNNEHVRKLEFSNLASTSLVFGASTEKFSVTTKRSWRASSDRIDCIAPRYIFLLTLTL